MAQPVWIAARVASDEGPGRYDAEILADQRRNGWVRARSTRPVAERVAADATEANTGPDVHLPAAQVLRCDGDDDPGQAATLAYPAVAALTEDADVYPAPVGDDTPHGAAAHAEATWARDIPGVRPCLRRRHDGGCARTTDSSALTVRRRVS